MAYTVSGITGLNRRLFGPGLALAIWAHCAVESSRPLCILMVKLAPWLRLEAMAINSEVEPAPVQIHNKRTARLDDQAEFADAFLRSRARRARKKRSGRARELILHDTLPLAPEAASGLWPAVQPEQPCLNFHVLLCPVPFV